MNEVSCRTVAPLVEAVKDRSLARAELVRGLSFSFETLEQPSNRIDWDEFTLLLENGARVLGGAEVLEDVAARYYTRSGGILAAVAGSVVSARPLYHMGARWYGPSLYANTKATCNDLDDGRIVQTIEIMPGYRDSDLFFRVMRAALSTVPSMLGQPPAGVELEREPRVGRFIIDPPPELSLWERITRVFHGPRRSDPSDREFQAYSHELRQGYALASEVALQLESETLERERAERMLEQARKFDALGRLAGGMAHDFNNMLTAISGYAELALERTDPRDESAEDIESIRAVAQRGGALVGQLLAYSRNQPRAPKRVDLSEFVSSMHGVLEQLLTPSIGLDMLASPSELPIVVDTSQLEQIVVNLVVNARDAMPAGGRIEIRTLGLRTEADHPLGPGLRCARLEVTDTGVGMDAATLARSFEPFFTTKGPGRGTGLGLATVYAVVTQSGGSIDLESEPEKGCTARIDLPIAREAVDAMPTPAPRSPLGPGGHETLLVVEEDERVRSVVRRTLEGRGYRVLTARDGDEARRRVREEPGPIELLVTDVVARGGEGRELAAEVEAARPELRGVLFLPAHGGLDPEQASLPTHSVLAKPFDPQRLLEAVRKLLDR